MSRAHLAQGRVRAPPGQGSAPRGRRGATWVGSSSTSPSPHLGARLAVSASQAAVGVQPGSPAAWGAAPLGERADPRASGSEQASTMPSAAAPRALTPLPVSGRSETGAVTRPESDGMAGPIQAPLRVPRGRSRGGEGTARGGEFTGSAASRGPGGGREGRVSPRREAGWSCSGEGCQSRDGGPVGRGSGSGSLSCTGLWPGSRRWGGGSPVAEEAPELTLDLPVAHSDPRQAKWGLPGGGPGKGSASKRITRPWVVRKRVFNNYPLFPQGKGFPGAVKPSLYVRSCDPGSF